MLDTSSLVALLRNLSYIKRSIRFTVHSSQFIVKSYEFELKVSTWNKIYVIIVNIGLL